MSPCGPCNPCGPVGPCEPVQSSTSTARSPFLSSVATSPTPFPFRSQQLRPFAPSVPSASSAPFVPGEPCCPFVPFTPAGPGIATDRTRDSSARMTAITLSILDTPFDPGEDDPSDSTSAMRRHMSRRLIVVPARLPHRSSARIEDGDKGRAVEPITATGTEGHQSVHVERHRGGCIN